MSNLDAGMSQASARNADDEQTTAWNMRIKLHDISLSRSDGAEEDDFKTWSQIQLVTRGSPNSALWYGPLDGQKQSLAFTSAANGFKKAQYNYDRGTKSVVLNNQLICDLYESRLEVCLQVDIVRPSPCPAWSAAYATSGHNFGV